MQIVNEHGPEPASEDESADEIGLVVPVAPVDHVKKERRPGGRLTQLEGGPTGSADHVVGRGRLASTLKRVRSAHMVPPASTSPMKNKIVPFTVYTAHC